MAPERYLHVFLISITLINIFRLKSCKNIAIASILQNFKAFIPPIYNNAPSHKHSIGIFEAQKTNFAMHNEAHKNLPHAYKKNV